MYTVHYTFMLHRLLLQNFRLYQQQKFEFSPEMTIIVGPNTAGKTNLVESIMLLSTGKSFRANKDIEMIRFGEEIAWVQGLLSSQFTVHSQQQEKITVNHELTNRELIKLEVTIAQGSSTGGRFLKRFKVNDIPKSRAHFVGYLPAVLFNPEALEIIVDGPSMRREFLNDVLESVDVDYRHAKTLYDKALRQRNALLELAQETGKRNAEQFSYWDELLITNGNILTQKREAFIAFVNSAEKTISEFQIIYDKSTISEERLEQYKDAEIGAGNTLVGPQRDDFRVTMRHPVNNEAYNVQQYASRGQQRLVILQLKLLHMRYIEQVIQQTPLLILDDIFSELDNAHIALVLEHVKGKQIVLTTTHEEFVKDIASSTSMIQLNK